MIGTIFFVKAVVSAAGAYLIYKAVGKLLEILLDKYWPKFHTWLNTSFLDWIEQKFGAKVRKSVARVGSIITRKYDKIEHKTHVDIKENKFDETYRRFEFVHASSADQQDIEVREEFTQDKTDYEEYEIMDYSY